jgi:four helix bundle protein
MLAYQRLDVYRCAVRALALSATISNDIPKGYSALSDQLRRAALSVSLNIAEGSGRPSGADAARFYGTARGSAMECAAVLDACAAIGVEEDERRREAVELYGRIVEMLSRMAR